ncbi:hypothetical protein [Lentzea nigeriaca]|uniref:hypothetical protein n=1 Tax=Lentzea nigeriaca TaxID=1128665 RepID=UPI00195DAC53|nr:hypothetical protein [Lentzea nigeriaca]MBM7860661.1 hypothetical protein [Lentzea nigeriaca]
MSDLRTLHDAFAELERRVDAAAAGTAPVVRPRRAVRLVPVAATVVAVAVLFAGAVWLVPGNSGTPVAGPPTIASSTTTARSPVPATPDELIARFRVVLGDTATFEVTDKHTLSGGPPSSKNNTPPGSGVVVPQTVNPDYPTTALIGGTLTTAGVTGSFSLTMMRSTDSEPSVWCGLYRGQTTMRPGENCVVSTLPDGSRLATESGQAAPGAASYLACLKRPDGTMVLMVVGNQEDPRGAAIGAPGGRIYAAQPPLTLEQLKAIVTSDKW